MDPLLGLFAASFAAATLFPLPSEAALFAYLKAYPEHTALALAVATLGNTAGGMTTYFLGRLLPNRRMDSRAVRLLHRWGAPVTFFAWLPIVGDALAAAAGWLRVNWLAALAFMAAGRLSRYIVVAAFA
ncbi:MAG TPA: DedA family protein [Burkholderiales bacterium]|nr:DedA family protein [Burkholderiales bacterium]